MEQRTKEWYAAHIGIITGSKLWKVMKTLRDGSDSKEWDNYKDEKITELLTGSVDHGYTSYDMQWGVDHEDEARKTFEEETGFTVEKVGLLPIFKGFAASPDGFFIDKNGDLCNVEIKCPETINHIKTVSGKEIKEDYQWQMDAEMMALSVYKNNECKKSYFISYDPRIKVISKRLYIQEYLLQNDRKSYILERVNRFLFELDALYSDFIGF